MEETKQVMLPEGNSLTAPSAMVCAENMQVAQVGAMVLRKNGNAVDAVAASCFAACVVDAHRFSLAGAGGNLLIWLEKKNRAYAIDFPPVAPADAKQGTFKLRPNGEVEDNRHLIGPRAATIPAVMAGLTRAVEQFGTLPLKEALAPAIDLASEGFHVEESFALAARQDNIRKFPDIARQFLKNNRSLRRGSSLALPELGSLLRRLAEEDSGAFYQGDAAHIIVDHLRSMGGLVTLEDMAEYRARVYPAFRGNYRDALIFGGPASTSSSSLLILTLNILEKLNLAPLPNRSIESCHWVLESVKAAWEEHRKSIGYVDKNIHPFELIAAKKLASVLLSRINPERAALSRHVYRTPLAGIPEVSSQIAAVDKDGNMAVLSQTLGGGLFGSGVTIPGLGLVINNGMAFFDHRRGRPYSLGPRKRARILMGTMLVLRKRKPFLAIGSTGGLSALAPMAQLLVDIIEHGQSLKQAFDLSRLFYSEDGVSSVEQTLPPMVRKGLQNKGHQIQTISSAHELPGPTLGIQLDSESRTGIIDSHRSGGALVGF